MLSLPECYSSGMIPPDDNVAEGEMVTEEPMTIDERR
jgi:hypothetical protein